jgi:hypothetical protein
MTRTLNTSRRPRGADQLKCDGRIESAIVERAADNRAGEPVRSGRKERVYIVERCKTSRSNDRDRDCIGESDRGIEIETAQHAVARDVGVDDGGNTGVFEALRDIEHGEFIRRCPAFDRNFAVASVEPDCNAARKSLGRILNQHRVAHRSSADNDARDSFIEPVFDAGTITDAAAELHRNFHGSENALDRGGVSRLAGESAVKIDDVEVFEPLGREQTRLLGRIAIKDRRPRHVALFETHGFAIFKIDRREEDHGFHCRKFAIKARPSFWLFSG